MILDRRSISINQNESHYQNSNYIASSDMSCQPQGDIDPNTNITQTTSINHHHHHHHHLYIDDQANKGTIL